MTTPPVTRSAASLSSASPRFTPPPILTKNPLIAAEIEYLSRLIEAQPQLANRYPVRWLAIQLIEGDTQLSNVLATLPAGPDLLTAAGESQTRLREAFNEDPDIILADQRYNFVNQVVQEVVTRPEQYKRTRSDRVDEILTSQWFGVPIFLTIMWFVFKFTTDVSAPYLDWVDGVITGPVTGLLLSLLALLGLTETWFASLLIDGVVAGVGGVLVFVPVLMSLYVALAVLEESGYMARAAFVMDGLMRRIGLHGKSFLPLIVGFGCTVPAIYATRTLENRTDRILTGLLVPFMSCGARLPVYVLFAAIFFPKYASVVIFGLYLLGVFTAIGVGLILRKTVFRSKEEPFFLMELPSYRWPSPRSVWQQTWQRTAAFIKNAWTVIVVFSVVLWVLLAIPIQGEGQFADTPVENSAFAGLSQTIAPVFGPLGFGTWEAGGALVTGLVAKEVIIATMAQIYGLDDGSDGGPQAMGLGDALLETVTSFGTATLDTLRAIPLLVGLNLFPEEAEPEPTDLMTTIRTHFEASSGGYGGLAGLAFMVFVLIYTPCIVTLVAARQEFGLRWMWVSVIGQSVLAWLMALMVFQVGKLILG